jgi:hypothetical protein
MSKMRSDLKEIRKITRKIKINQILEKIIRQSKSAKGD